MQSNNPFTNAPSKYYNLSIFPTQQVKPTHYFFKIKIVMSPSCILEACYLIGIIEETSNFLVGHLLIVVCCGYYISVNMEGYILL